MADSIIFNLGKFKNYRIFGRTPTGDLSGVRTKEMVRPIPYRRKNMQTGTTAVITFSEEKQPAYKPFR